MDTTIKRRNKTQEKKGKKGEWNQNDSSPRIVVPLVTLNRSSSAKGGKGEGREREGGRGKKGGGRHGWERKKEERLTWQIELGETVFLKT